MAFELLCGEIKESGRHGYPPTVSATLGLEPDTRRRSKSGGKKARRSRQIPTVSIKRAQGEIGPIIDDAVGHVGPGEPDIGYAGEGLENAEDRDEQITMGDDPFAQPDSGAPIRTPIGEEGFDAQPNAPGIVYPIYCAEDHEFSRL